MSAICRKRFRRAWIGGRGRLPPPQTEPPADVVDAADFFAQIFFPAAFHRAQPRVDEGQSAEGPESATAVTRSFLAGA